MPTQDSPKACLSRERARCALQFVFGPIAYTVLLTVTPRAKAVSRCPVHYQIEGDAAGDPQVALPILPGASPDQVPVPNILANILDAILATPASLAAACHAIVSAGRSDASAALTSC